MKEMKPDTPQSPDLDAEMERASRLSAFMDGEVGVSECQSLVRASALPGQAARDEAEVADTVLATWSEYHVISRVLRGQPVMASASTQAFLQHWRAQVGDSIPEANVPAHRDQAGQVLSPWQGSRPCQAANDARWHWFSAAAVMGLAVALIGQLQPSGVSGEASGQVVAVTGKNSTSAPVSPPVQEQKQEDMAMIRNPVLDEFLLAHRRQGGASALQVPAGFMRGASTSNSP